MIPCCPDCDSSQIEHKSNRGTDRNGKWYCNTCHTHHNVARWRDPKNETGSEAEPTNGLARQLWEMDASDL